MDYQIDSFLFGVIIGIFSFKSLEKKPSPVAQLIDELIKKKPNAPWSFNLGEIKKIKNGE